LDRVGFLGERISDRVSPLKRILITGGLGFIGSHLVDRIISRYEVTVLDDLSSGQIRNVSQHLDNPKFKLVRGSILDLDALEEAIQDVDAVVHLAAIASVVRSIEEPHLVHRTNVEGTLNVLESIVKHSVEKVILASSAAVYGNQALPPLTEDLPCNPSSLYGATKLAAEAYVNAYGKTHGLKTVILRLMNVYGSRMSLGPYAGVMTRFAEALLTGKPFTVYGDGEQTRDFVHVTDVTSAMASALQSDQAIGNTFNIGTGSPSTINRLAVFFSSMGMSNPLICHMPASIGDVRESYANIERATEVLLYRPKVSLEEGIESFTKWYRDGQEMFLEKSTAG
jgi:UDP-glucose 4-epimerase